MIDLISVIREKRVNMAKKNEINVTIKIIAQQLGISFSTVAKALNNDPVVKEETRKRVKDKAAELGYLPNIIARGLRSKSTKTIGIILNDIENPTRTHIVKQVSIDLAKNGFTTLIFDSQYDLEIEKNNMLSALSRMPDAIIISPVSIKSNNLQLLKNMFDRTIILSRSFDSIPANYVHMDHKRGGFISATTMLEFGHTLNLVLNDPKDAPSGIQFIEGVKQAYKEKGISFNDNYVFSFFPSIENSTNLIISLFDFSSHSFKLPFTGIISSYDILACGVYQAASKIGLIIPDDISVLGYDDIPIARLLTPPLSTIHMPSEEIASRCSEILIAKLVNNDMTLKQFSLKPHLVLRDSIKRINPH